MSHCNETKSPFMALVDAAASILDENNQSGKLLLECGTSSDGSLHSVEESSRPSTPPANKASPPHSVSPTSVSSGTTTRSVEDSLTEKKLSFAEQLMVMLDDEAFSDILAWMPDGKAFTIVDPKRFTKDFMPSLFNIRNMSSFVRKLSRWGFARVHEKETMNSDIFKHPDFQKGNSSLCREIRCVGRISVSGASVSPTGPSGVAPPASKIHKAPSLSSPSVMASQVPSHASMISPPPLPNMAHYPAPYSTVQQKGPEALLETLALRRYLEQQAMSSHPRLYQPHQPPSWLRARPDNYFPLNNRRALAAWASHGNPSALPY